MQPVSAIDPSLPEVQILLATYNGGAFLREQIESLLAQDYPRIRILAHDDGSTDDTMAILKEYEAQGKLTCYQGKNTGATGSFLDLACHADLSADYFAFCDQDDVWLPGKISAGVRTLQAQTGDDRPAAYGCRSSIVDEHLQRIEGRNRQEKPLVPSFGNAIAQCILQGCTAVMNRPMMAELQNHTPKAAVAHDWWVYLIATGCGQMIFDQTPYVLYRQHSQNVLGRPTLMGRLQKYGRIRRKFGREHAWLKQTEEFAALYADRLNAESRALLAVALGYRQGFGRRLKLVFHRRIRRLRLLDDLIWRFVCLFDLI